MMRGESVTALFSGTSSCSSCSSSYLTCFRCHWKLSCALGAQLCVTGDFSDSHLHSSIQEAIICVEIFSCLKEEACLPPFPAEVAYVQLYHHPSRLIFSPLAAFIYYSLVSSLLLSPGRSSPRLPQQHHRPRGRQLFLLSLTLLTRLTNIYL